MLSMALVVYQRDSQAGWGDTRRTHWGRASPTTFSCERTERTMTTPDTAGKPGDAIDILGRDHEKVKQLFKDYAALASTAPTAVQNALVQQICTELIIHTALEEEIFYPAVRKMIKDDDLMNEAEIEHDAAKFLIKQIVPVKPDDEYLHAKVAVLREYIKHHINEEESQMFPKIRKAQFDLSVLGQQMMARKTALQTQLTTPELVVEFFAVIA
jgi:hemerythrin superfamily protein